MFKLFRVKTTENVNNKIDADDVFADDILPHNFIPKELTQKEILDDILERLDRMNAKMDAILSK